MYPENATVLVQREMECRRAPLASIPPIPRGSLRLPPAERGGSRRNGNWFQEKGSWRSRSQQGGAPERKTNWLRKEN